MTRENKLALVVGFGLILLVGILISDHFSTASSQQSAEFPGRAADPLLRRGPDESLVTATTVTNSARFRQDRPGLDEAPAPQEMPARTPVRPAGPPPSDNPAEADPSGSPRAGTSPFEPVEMGTPVPRRIPDRASPAPSGPMRTHHVRAGESMTSIARHYYQTDDLVQALAAFNGIDDPNRLSVNRRLNIPDEAVLRGGAPRSTEPAAAPARPQTPRTYTVQAGDTLSVIASKELGSVRHTTRLFEANRHILRDMNDLLPGMVLQLPDI